MTSHLTVERRLDPLGLDSPRPRFAWRPPADQAAYQVQVIDTHDPAADWSTPTWDSGRQASAESTYVAYGGPPLRSRHRYAWRVRVWTSDAVERDWSAAAHFEMGLLEPTDWSARWIAHIVPDLVSEPEERLAFRPSPILRRRFSVPDAPRRARLYITALGAYEAALNGQRIGEEWLAPGWTSYHTRIQYQTLDAGPLVRVGDNLLEVRLGDGWYAGSVGAWGRRRYGDGPALLCQLEAQLGSGEMFVIGSDAEWRSADSGTWMHDLQLGERTDFRKEPAVDGEEWRTVSLRADPGARLVAARDDGVRVVDHLPARSVRAADGQRFIVDLGANAAGVLRLQLANASAGQHVVLRHAEALDAQGELYTENLRGAEQRDEFILAAPGPAVLQPRFTFHGFRYAEVAGLDPLAEPDIQTCVLSSAARLVGSFTCSDERVNQLQHNIVTSLRANFISVPTDCPQRNERLGWTADLQIFAPTALFNADVTNLLDKWMDDMLDAQLPSGAYADVAPCPSGFVGWGNTAWSDAGVIVPWTIYQRSGDVGVLERCYASMRRYLRFLEADQTDGLRFGGRYGDWVSLGARTDKLLIGTGYLAYVAGLFVRIAATLGQADDEADVRAFAESVRRAFEWRFIGPDGRLTVETQTAYAMALGFELLPLELRAAAGDRLAQLVEAADTHLATGFLGTPLVLPALSEHGHHELACRLVRQDTYPSWLFEVRHGATSIWERWNGWTPEQGFYSPRMNSFNHYAFGAVGDWMYRYLAGLDPVEPGYRRTAVRPRPAGGFTSARASHESLYGRHTSAWRLEGDSLHLEVDVPPNTTATLHLPHTTAPKELPPGHHAVTCPVHSGPAT